MGSVTIELAAARAALASDDEVSALEHLIAAWQITRDERLAAAIQLFGNRVELRFKALSGRTSNDRYAAFMTTAGAKRQADLARLVGLLPKLAYGDVSTALDHLLYEWPPTPRMGPLLATASLGGYSDRVRELGVAHASAHDARLTAEELRRLVELEPLLADQADTGDALLDQVYADPDADAPRLVFADWATSRGDPRGELIALQFARRDRVPDAAAIRREREILAQHQRRWLEPIWTALRHGSVRFERGFLASAMVEPFAVIAPKPEWATVTALELSYHEAVPMQAFPALRELRNVTPQLLAQIAERPTRLVHLGLADARPGARSPVDRYQPLWSSSAFSALRSIGIAGTPGEWALLWERDLQIERVETNAANAAAWLGTKLPAAVRALCFRTYAGRVRFANRDWTSADIALESDLQGMPDALISSIRPIPAATLRACRVVTPRKPKRDTLERLERIVRRAHPDLERFTCEVDPFA